MGLFDRIQDVVDEIKAENLDAHKIGVPDVPGVPDTENPLGYDDLSQNAIVADERSKSFEEAFQIDIIAESSREVPPHPDGQGVVKCCYCGRLVGGKCTATQKTMLGIALLHECRDYLANEAQKANGDALQK